MVTNAVTETRDQMLNRLRTHGQEHLWSFADRLSTDEQDRLARRIEAIDFTELATLTEQAKKPSATLDPSSLQPLEVLSLPKSETDRKRRNDLAARGEEAIRAGRVAAVVVAGGQGSRLGFEHPKGMYPIGPVNGTSLFQIFAEKLLWWRNRSGQPIPWYIMTSEGNREETEQYFKTNGFFGLPESDVRFFNQGMVPAVDAATGRVLLAKPGELFLSPNGHGGTLAALRTDGILDDMASRGIDLISYFQVDNPFVEVIDPVYIGYHLEQQAEMSAKVVRKRDAGEKVGIVCRYQGLPTVIEYSDLPAEIGRMTGPDGELLYWAGSIAIHLFNRSFLERITTKDLHLPFHFARKAVPYIDAQGQTVTPKEPNAVKFEMFIFDALPLAKRVAIQEVGREDEFMPVKNPTGIDSAETTRQAMIARAAEWLKQAGIEYPKNTDDTPAVPLEISPLFGRTAEDFKAAITERNRVTEPTYFSPETTRRIES